MNLQCQEKKVMCAKACHCITLKGTSLYLRVVIRSMNPYYYETLSGIEGTTMSL